MNRALIIGCPGAGKSNFCRRLSAKTGLPIHYLDVIWHKPDRTNISKEEFDKKLESILLTDEWIIDGNYLRTMPRRLKECDTVFFFDISLDECLSGVISRLGKPREDMPWIDTELDEEFHQWILNFPAEQRPEIVRLLNTFDGEVFHFKSREDANNYLASLKK